MNTLTRTPLASTPVGAAAPDVPAAFSRRTMLRGLGVTGLAALLAPTLLDGGFAHATPDDSHRGRPAPKKAVGAGAGAQPTPYALQASSELSREFFMTSEVKIQDGDYVYPFVNPKNGNQVEAIVFASGTVNHLRRDATSATGWTYAPFDLQGLFSTVNDVAVAANGTDVYVLLFGTPELPGNMADAPAWLTTLTGPASWDPGFLATYDDLGIDGTAEQGVVKGGISREGTPYFSTTWVDGTTTTLGGWVATGNWDIDPLVYQQYLQLDTTDAAVQDSTILYDTNTSDPNNPTGFAVVLFSDGDLNVYPQDGEVFDITPMSDAGTTGVTELLWAWASPTSTTSFPGYAFQTASGTGFVDENSNYNAVADVALKADNAVAVWRLNDLYTVNLLDSDGTLQMIQELSSSGTGSWATPIPLVPDLQAVFGVPTDPTESTLFAVGLDESLSVLSLGATGWTQTQVHQTGEEMYDFSAYRVQATVTDTNGTAVPGAQVTIATDRPVAAWTPTGSLPVTPDAPLTVTADVKGEITFSIPAEELDVAMLTLQALDANNNPTGGTYLVTADTDVRGFLGGTGALSDLGPLTGPTMTGATLSGSSTALFPTLTDAGAASQSVQALNQLIKTGDDAQNGSVSGSAAFALDLSSGEPTYTPGAGQIRLEGEHLTFSFGHLFDSIGHAIRHGAMALSKAVVHLAEDGIHWAVDLALKIGDAIVNFTDLVITDMKSAFHVIGGFFATLGADIKAAVEWLAHDVVALLEAAKSSAAQLQTWFVDLGTNVTTTLTGIEIDTDTWFSSKEAQAHAEISNLENLVEGTLGGPTLPAPSDTGSSSDQSKLGKDLSYLGTVMNDAPGKWLLDKLLSYLPVTDTGPVIAQGTFEPLLQQLSTDWVDAMALADSLWTFVQTTMSDAFSTNGAADKGKLSSTQVTDWFTDLDTVVHDGLLLLDALADTFLDLCKTAVALIEDYFTYQYNLVSSMGIIGLILEEVGVDIHFSLSEILSWVVAFPATLIARCRGYSALFPTSAGDDSDADRGRKRRRGKGGTEVGAAPDGWQVGLGITGAVAQGIWGFADLVGDLQQFYDSDTGKRGVASGLIDYFDILCPLVETIALWPSEPNSDGSASYPFHGGIATSSTDFELLPFVVWSAVLPSAFGAVAKAGWTDDLSNSGFPSGVQDVAKDYMSPFVQMIAGTVNTVLGGVYSGKNNAGWVAILGTVLGNLSFVGAPLATKVMNETTDDVSTLVKLAIDAGGNIGAAVCIAEATSLPTP